MRFMIPDREICVEKIRIPSKGRKMPALVLYPKQRPEPATGVLWIHGGGYITGMKEMVHMSRAVDLVKRFGAAVISPGYRLAPFSPYPAAAEDCYAALLYLKEHAAEIGVRGKVWNTRKHHMAWRCYLRGQDRENLSPYAAPARLEDFSGLPPAYTFVCDGEPFYAETMGYVQKLRVCGIPAEADVYHSDMHAFDMLRPGLEISREAVRRFGERFAYAQAHYFAPQKKR